jgi:hypothetical protein
VSIKEGDIVYIRARATKKATFYNRGCAMEDGITVVPISRDGKSYDDAYLYPPRGSVVSKDALQHAAVQQVRAMYGIDE